MPDYYPKDLFEVWERQQEHAQQMRFGVPEMERDEILRKVQALKDKKRYYYDDTLMGSLLEVLYAYGIGNYYDRIVGSLKTMRHIRKAMKQTIVNLRTHPASEIDTIQFEIMIQQAAESLRPS